jgi:hypothetical protein
MLIRPWGQNNIDDIFPKLRILDAFAHIDFISGTTEEQMPDFKNIKSLYHFTPIFNIPNILKYGLLSRDQFENIGNMMFYNLFGLYTDKDRNDGRKEYISCSINKPFYKMLKKKRWSYKKYGGIAIIKLNKHIINSSNWTLFCDGLASQKANANKTDDELSNPEKIIDENGQYKIESEILIRDNIPLDFFESVNFSSRDWVSYCWACYFRNNYDLWSVDFQINDKMFSQKYEE